MFFFWKNKPPFNNLQESKLFDETSFYKQFINDLYSCQKEVIIESPYVTSSRMEVLLPVFKKLLSRGILIYIVTRDPVEHDDNMRDQATNELLACYEMGISVKFLKGNFHRKVALIDNEIIWEGSLNILSQSNSQEIMRRTFGKKYVAEYNNFLSKHSVTVGRKILL